MDPDEAHRRACIAVNLDGLTLHGLRRSFASLTEWLEVPAGVVADSRAQAQRDRREHYKRRPLDLLRVHHERIEAWFLNRPVCSSMRRPHRRLVPWVVAWKRYRVQLPARPGCKPSGQAAPPKRPLGHLCIQGASGDAMDMSRKRRSIYWALSGEDVPALRHQCPTVWKSQPAPLALPDRCPGFPTKTTSHASVGAASRTLRATGSRLGHDGAAG